MDILDQTLSYFIIDESIEKVEKKLIKLHCQLSTFTLTIANQCTFIFIFTETLLTGNKKSDY